MKILLSWLVGALLIVTLWGLVESPILYIKFICGGALFFLIVISGLLLGEAIGEGWDK